MLFLEEAKKQYLQTAIQRILDSFSSPELMGLYHQVCEATTPPPL
jgi:hypothetical protein